MRKLLLVLLLISCFFCFHLDAQTTTWAKRQGPYGGSIRKIIVHPTGTVYALTGNSNNYGIYQSADNGNNWVEHAPAVMGDDAHRIYDIELRADGSIYALAYYNLYRTTDNGTTWTQLNTGEGPANAGFEVAEEFGIIALSGTLLVAGYNYGDGQNTVYRSVNNGTTWTKGYQGQRFDQLTVDSDGSVFGLANGNLWKSTNDGSTFVQLAGPVPADIISSTTSLVAKSDGTQLAVATGNSTIYLSSSPFTTWTPVIETSIADPTTYGDYAKLLYSADNSTLYLFDNGNDKVYTHATVTTGAWTQKTTTFVNAAGEDASCVASRDVANLYVGTGTSGVFKSVNTGIGWSEVNTGIEGVEAQNLAIADNGNIIVAGRTCFRSTDEGLNWVKIPEITGTNYYTVIKVTTGLSAGDLLLLAKGGGPSFRSDNYGVNWTAITAPTPGNAYNFVSPDGAKIFGYNSDDLYFSPNSGADWHGPLAISGLPASYRFEPYGDNSVAMDQNGVAYIALYDFAPPGTIKLFKIIPNNIINPTTATATHIPTATLGIGSFFQTVKYLNNKIYVLGDPISGSGSVLTSTANAGVNWTQKTVPNAFQLAVDPINNYLFLTRSNGSSYTISISRNDGDTWTATTVNLASNYTYPYGIALNSNGFAFAGFASSSVHRTEGTIVTPPTPSGLMSAGSSPNRIMLQFNDNAINEQYYVVEQFNGVSYDSITRTGSFSSSGGKGYAEIRNLQPNTSYTFKVYAQNAAGKSGEVSITTSTLEACVVTFPDNKSWSGNVNGTTTLTNVSIKHIGAGVYSISDVNNSAYIGSTTVPGTFAIGCVGPANQTYLFPGYPFTPNGNGTWNSGTNTLVLRWITNPGITPAVTGVVTLIKNANDPAPAAPTNAAAYIYSDNSVEVNWLPVAFENTFTIERKTGAGGTYATVGSPVNYPTLNFIDPGPFVVGTTYFYRIKSANGNAVPQESPYSNEAQVTFNKPNFVLGQTTVNSTPFNSLGTIWADFNKDGFDDLILTKFELFTGTQSAPLVFQNNGAGDFTSVVSTIEDGNYLTGTSADYDNDGDLDLFYSALGQPSHLYNGNGTFTFTKVDPTAVAEGSIGDFEGAPFSASWVDYDKDGLLDLFVARSGDFNSSLFKQNPDHSFTKIATAGDLVNTVMDAFGIAWADYDNDGDQDVFVIDQTTAQAPKLFRNNGAGTFTKVTGSVFDAETADKPQCVAWGDFDNDQNFDLFLGDKMGVNKLFKNNGNGTFTKIVATAFDVTNGGALGANWGDVNNDGFIDLLVTGQAGNVLFINSNGTAFTRVTQEKFNDTQLFCIASASSDFNNDGFIDISLSRTALQGGSALAANSLLFKNNNTTGNWLKIKLNCTVSNASAIGARVRVTAGAQNQIREVHTHIGIASQNSLVQHFGLGASTTATVVVTWPSGVIQTLTGQAANTLITVTEDATGPAASVLSPAHNAVNVASTTTLSVTLNEANTPVSGKMLLLYQGGNFTTPITGVDVTAAVKSGNTYTFTISPKLLPGTQYNVSIDAGAFLDGFGNASLEFPSGLWTFTTTVAADATPPVITLLPLAVPFSIDFESRIREITVTDNVGVTSVVVSIRKISESTYSTPTVVQGTGADINKWTVLLNEAAHFDAIGAELFVTATDAAGNTSRNPDGTGTIKIFLNYEGDQAATIDSDHIGFGGTKASWKVFSIPFDLGSNNAVTTIFDEITANAALANKIDYKLLTIQSGGTDWTEYPAFSTINRGQGYFINIKTATTIKVPSTQAPANSRDNLFPVNLNQGWNMVGNPYLTTISWDNVATLNTLTGDAGDILKYNGTTYVAAEQTLEPYEGAFVFSATARPGVKIPFLGQTVEGGRKGYRNVGSDIDAEEWMVRLNLKQLDHRYELGAVGMTPEASLSYDDYDGVTPPRFIDYLEMNFAHSEHFAKRFTRDFVPTQSGYIWDFTADSNLEGQAEISWDNTTFSSSTNELYLLDINRQKLVNMAQTSSYSFNPKESANFKVYFGENLRIAPDKVHLGKAWPNPTSGSTLMTFSLPESGGLDQLVTLDIIDAMGREMGTISTGRFNPGYHEVSWNAKELTNGFYTYRLTVQGKQGRTIQVNKLIIK